ncbi:gluconokinase [Cumulibacter manganitolerans]|uniref:gluconokinase n=1 Tax=Cumulibacter manganitolerans TaxID=1884992 RepID=UPI0012960594|nr:gluconokinase [Cumulibacter manganitolerans]
MQPTVVVMGVSGCGKTTVGRQVAERLGIPFADADDFHPRANVLKMAAGHPLTDEDRRPWLEECGRWLAQHAGTGCVLACSALKVAYRDRLRRDVPEAVFVHLDGPEDVIARRVAARRGHFMPATLVRSQYDALERLTAGEHGVVVSFDQPLSAIVRAVLAQLRPA